MSLKESNYSEHKCQYSAFCKPNQVKANSMKPQIMIRKSRTACRSIGMRTTAKQDAQIFLADIGGFSLGLDALHGIGITVERKFCEFDKHSQAILKKHWLREVPFRMKQHVRTQSDGKAIGEERVMKVLDLFSGIGGFSLCQDLISRMESKQASMATVQDYTCPGNAKKSLASVVPRYAIFENVAGLLSMESESGRSV